MNEKERFQLLIKHYGTQEKLGAVLGLPQSSIANWVQRGALSANAIRLIGEKCPEINLRWLITGEGEMLEPEQVTAVVDKNCDDSEPTPMREVGKFYADLDVSAGHLEYVAADCAPTAITIPVGTQAEAYFPVIGYSMEPTICEGDIIGVKELDCFEPVEKGKIYMVITRDCERMVKRIIPPSDEEPLVQLISDNKKQQTIKLDRQMISKILRVVFIGKQL